MSLRSPELQEFVDALEAAFAVSRCEAEVAAVAQKLFAALRRAGPPEEPRPSRLPVCDCLPTALELAKSVSPPLSRLARAFETIEPRASWRVRASGGPSASANWPQGHANATLIGPDDALERREDVRVGVSLLAPKVRYPDHRHPPEEIYLLLTPGRFQHGESGWFAPGAGGTLHNTPNIVHAMASRDAPLLAIWGLLLV